MTLLVVAIERWWRIPSPKVHYALQHVSMPPQQYGEMLLRFLEAGATFGLEVRAGAYFFETANGFKQRLNYLSISTAAMLGKTPSE